MGAHRHYVLGLRFPDRLVYPSAAVALEIVRHQWSGRGDTRWVFRARKLIHGPESTCVIVSSPVDRRRLEWILHHEGFLLEEGTPPATIMQRLVHEGYATTRRARGRER